MECLECSELQGMRLTACLWEPDPGSEVLPTAKVSFHLCVCSGLSARAVPMRPSWTWPRRADTRSASDGVLSSTPRSYTRTRRWHARSNSTCPTSPWKPMKRACRRFLYSASPPSTHVSANPYKSNCWILIIWVCHFESNSFYRWLTRCKKNKRPNRSM